MQKIILTNSFIMLCISVVSYGVFIWVLQQLNIEVLWGKIQLAFILNTVLAILIVAAMVVLKKRIKDQLAYVFMGGSFLKFACFFIFFYPAFNQDGQISKTEFFSFFIPYAVCLVSETITAIRFLNKIDAY
ncbi:MAG: DUF6168 family protein [Flavobacteriaceae bacterium]